MTRVLAMTLGLLVGLAPATSFAVQNGEAFSGLIGELEERRDNDFSGTLDKTGKKQQKAVLKALATLGKTSTSATSDTKLLGKALKGLSKAYPTEFQSGSPNQDLSNRGWNVTNVFRQAQFETAVELQYTIARLGSDALAKKVEALRVKALTENQNYVEAQTVFDAVSNISKVAKYLDGAAKSVTKDKGGGNYFFVGSSGTNPLVTDDPFVEFKVSNGQLQLYGTFTNPKSGVVTSVAVVVEATDGVGTYTTQITGFYTVGSTRYDIVDGTASVTLDTFDLDNSVVAGTCSFSAHNAGNGVTLTYGRGEFRLTEIFIQ